METNDTEKRGLTREELKAFFDHVYLFCRGCSAIQRKTSPEGCRRNSCVLFMIRNVPMQIHYRPEILDRLLLEREQPKPEDPRSRGSYPTMLWCGWYERTSKEETEADKGQSVFDMSTERGWMQRMPISSQGSMGWRSPSSVWQRSCGLIGKNIGDHE